MKLGLGQALGLGQGAVAPEEEVPPGDPTWTFTINPAEWTYNPGEEYGGPQVTHSLSNWSSGLYFEFCDASSEVLLTLMTVGTSHTPGTEYADAASFLVGLKAGLDTVDAGLTFGEDPGSPGKWDFVFTIAPKIGSVSVALLNVFCDVGSSPSFSNPITLVEVPG